MSSPSVCQEECGQVVGKGSGTVVTSGEGVSSGEGVFNA